MVVSPGLTTAVANSLADRFADAGKVSITVILDSDPEVYRMGYGEPTALVRLQEAARDSMFDLRLQKGVRIGLVISDELTMIFCPVPLMIEAGSTSAEKPNAIILSGTSSNRLADAVGSGPSGMTEKHEIGTQPLTPTEIQSIQDDLKDNPPQAFDIARSMRVFSSRIQYVEIRVENYRMSSRQIELPPELTGISDEKLQKQITSRVRVLSGNLDSFETTVKTINGEQCKVKMDERWIKGERKRLEDEYTFLIPKYGRVILRSKREMFGKEVNLFKKHLDDYHKGVLAEFEKIKDNFKQSLINEYLPKWKINPPESYKEHNVEPTDDNLMKDLEVRAEQVVKKAVQIEPPRIHTVYKNIAPESAEKSDFLEPLKLAMRRRNVPMALIDDLFSSLDAAPSANRESRSGQ